MRFLMMINKLVFILLILVFTNQVFADELSATKTLEKIQNNPPALFIFLQNMPKGGDLHNHLGGASMAENMMQYAKNDALCVDRKTYSVTAQPSCAPGDLLNQA